jgi:hypothetical protein
MDCAGWVEKQKIRWKEPYVNSSRFTLPSITPPAAIKRSTGVAVYGAVKFAKMREAAVEGVPRTQKILLP